MEGCETNINGSVVTCSCNHLTNFAFSRTCICSRFQDCTESPVLETVLETLSIIGVHRPFPHWDCCYSCHLASVQVSVGSCRTRHSYPKLFVWSKSCLDRNFPDTNVYVFL